MFRLPKLKKVFIFCFQVFNFV